MRRSLIKLTLADLVAVGVSTALLIGMMTGLTFFILEVTYFGSYLATLKWVLFFFVVAIVLIARIALAIDPIRAVFYAVALAGVTALAINRFVDIPSTGLLGPASGLVPYALLGVVWWCAHKLTRDCTHTEESADDTGLLDHPPRSEEPGAWLKEYQRERELERKRHRPGSWLIRFTLATSPLFVLGQWLLPPRADDRRAFAFWMVTLYIGCALGLLATTSFLGLRRYLDQRRLSMPWKMTLVWLGLGGGLIAAILLLAMLLPRPQAELGLGKVLARSQQRHADQHAMLKLSHGDGPGAQGSPQSQRAATPQPQNSQRASGQRGQSDPQSDGSVAKSGAKGQGSGNRSEGRGQQQAGGARSGSGQGRQQGTDGQGQNKPESEPQDQQDGRQPQDQARQPQTGSPLRAERQQRPESPQNQPRGGAPDADTQADVPQQQERGDYQQWSLEPPAPPLATPWWLWLLLLLALGIAAFWYRNELLSFVRRLWGLFGSQQRPPAVPAVAGEQEPITATPSRPPPFASFRNPFEHLSDFESSEAVVRYSFDALQAWAYEENLGRAQEETPLEFTARLGAERPELEKTGRRLAEIYSQVTYAKAKVGPGGLASVREFWDSLPSRDAEEAAVR